MKQHPLISVVTPSLNQAAFIRQTIESVLSQDYQNIEYIVMDGGSTDETVNLLKDYAKVFERTHKSKQIISFRWFSKKDNGQADAINKGLKMAKGDIVCYLNSDDYFLPRALSRVAAVFGDHPDIDWVTGDYIIIDDKGNRIQQFVSLYKRMLRTFHVPIQLTNFIIQPSTFWRRSRIKHVGQFDTTLVYTFDYDFWLRLSKLTKPWILGDTLSAFRIHKKSKGGAMYKKQFEEEMQVLARYTNSQAVLTLHQLHNALITWIYDQIK